MAEFHGIRGEAANPEAVCANYAALLKTRPPDFALLGIGENGELGAIASRDCSFNDSAAVKVTDSAIILTIPMLVTCQSLFLIATGKSIQKTERAALTSEVSPTCPVSILQTHPNAHLFVEREAAPFLFSQ